MSDWVGVVKHWLASQNCRHAVFAACSSANNTTTTTARANMVACANQTHSPMIGAVNPGRESDIIIIIVVVGTQLGCGGAHQLCTRLVCLSRANVMQTGKRTKWKSVWKWTTHWLNRPHTLGRIQRNVSFLFQQTKTKLWAYKLIVKLNFLLGTSKKEDIDNWKLEGINCFACSVNRQFEIKRFGEQRPLVGKWTIKFESMKNRL